MNFLHNINDKIHLISQDKRKLKKLVDGKNFDLFIMFIILADALVLGLMANSFMSVYYADTLFLLDRMFMGIFIVEMFLKVYANGRIFFKNGWNVFDLSVVLISIIPVASAFIVLRTFRLFRLLRYINKFSRLKQMINMFIAMMPSFVALVAVLAVFFYVFAIIGVSLFGYEFVEFSTLGGALFTLLQAFTLDGWATRIARPIMQIYPHAWIYFVTFGLSCFLVFVSFFLVLIDRIQQIPHFNRKCRL